MIPTDTGVLGLRPSSPAALSVRPEPHGAPCCCTWLPEQNKHKFFNKLFSAYMEVFFYWVLILVDFPISQTIYDRGIIKMSCNVVMYF